LSQFSRRARWLNILFPASVAPTITDPNVRSDDVSLVADYDGGGFGFSNPSTLCTRSAAQAPSASGGGVLITTGLDEIFRIMALDVITVAGGSPRVWFIAIDKEGTGESVAITQAFGGPAVGEQDNMRNQTATILGPGMTLTFQWINGDVATVVTFGVYGFRAPLGTSFKV